jgi:hypothetical protein
MSLVQDALNGLGQQYLHCNEDRMLLADETNNH